MPNTTLFQTFNQLRQPTTYPNYPNFQLSEIYHPPTPNSRCFANWQTDGRSGHNKVFLSVEKALKNHWRYFRLNLAVFRVSNKVKIQSIKSNIEKSFGPKFLGNIFRMSYTKFLMRNFFSKFMDLPP